MTTPTAGPLWPHGPAQLPCIVQVADERYTVPTLPPLRLAYAISRGVLIVPDLLTDDDRDRVRERLRNPIDGLGDLALQQATVHLISRLGGIAEGVNGWRAAYRLCSGLLSEWPLASGLLLEIGIDPATAPLWQTLSVFYRRMVADPNADKDEAKKAKVELFAPLRGEPAWMQPVKPPPLLSPSVAKANALALYERVTGKKAVLPDVTSKPPSSRT